MRSRAVGNVGKWVRAVARQAVVVDTTAMLAFYVMHFPLLPRAAGAFSFLLCVLFRKRLRRLLAEKGNQPLCVDNRSEVMMFILKVTI